jgi:hypothetical protein
LLKIRTFRCTKPSPSLLFDAFHLAAAAFFTATIKTTKRLAERQEVIRVLRLPFRQKANQKVHYNEVLPGMRSESQKCWELCVVVAVDDCYIEQETFVLIVRLVPSSFKLFAVNDGTSRRFSVILGRRFTLRCRRRVPGSGSIPSSDISENCKAVWLVAKITIPQLQRLSRQTTTSAIHNHTNNGSHKKIQSSQVV